MPTLFSQLINNANIERDSTIVADNYYTTETLLNHLFINHGVAYVGTLRSNRVPVGLVTPSIQQFSYNINTTEHTVALPFAFVSKSTCTMYVCKDINEFKLLTNVPALVNGDVTNTLAKINRSQWATFGVNGNMHTVVKETPLACKFYNSNMGAVDSLDRLLESYQFQRRTGSFIISYYYYYLNVVIANSFYLYQIFCGENDEPMMSHLSFRDSLCHSLLSCSSQITLININQMENHISVQNKFAVSLQQEMPANAPSWVPFLLKKKNKFKSMTRINKRAQPKSLKRE